MWGNDIMNVVSRGGKRQSNYLEIHSRLIPPSSSPQKRGRGGSRSENPCFGLEKERERQKKGKIFIFEKELRKEEAPFPPPQKGGGVPFKFFSPLLLPLLSHGISRQGNAPFPPLKVGTQYEGETNLGNSLN